MTHLPREDGLRVCKLVLILGVMPTSYVSVFMIQFTFQATYSTAVPTSQKVPS